MVSFELVAVAVCESAVGWVVGVSASADWDYFVDFWCSGQCCPVEVFVDWFAAEVAGVVLIEDLLA